MTRIVFDTGELYFMTQYLPVFRALEQRGAEASFVAYENRPTMHEGIRRGIAKLGLPVTWCETLEEGLALYRRERPAWVVFGNQYPYVDRLPPDTRSAMLYHGIGMKADVFAASIMRMDVRFMEGSYYERGVRALYPDRNVVGVGYAKLDPLFGPRSQRPECSLPALGLDPARRTLLYAPTMSPSSFPRMSDRWPEHFADFNLIVKPHYLSFFSSSRKSHRRKMDLWSRAPNVYVAPIDEWDPLPFMQVADLLISDVSAMVYEFAALDKPAVCCDFLKLHLFRRGPFRYRLRRRMHETMRIYWDTAAHARKYRHLRDVVDRELADPGRLRAERRRATEELIGPTDGRVSERIADYLVAHALGDPRARGVQVTAT